MSCALGKTRHCLRSFLRLTSTSQARRSSIGIVLDCDLRRFRIPPGLLDCLVASRADVVANSSFDHGRFRVAFSVRDGSLARVSVRRFSSDTSKVADKEKTKRKQKTIAASAEILRVSDDDPRSIVADKPEKKSLLQKTWSLVAKIGSGLKTMASMSRQDWAKWFKNAKTKVWLELQHYWVGSKLLWAEIRISTRLLFQLSAGKKLSRREQLQLKRTAGDMARLVPFIIIVIVPFMEFLLPVLLKVFPNMLPSTFQDKMKQEVELKKRLEGRLHHAKSLKTALLEMADELKTKQGDHFRKTGKDLDDFMNKVRSGQSIQNAEILGFAQLFNDELTLDNISRPRLISMCKYMGLRPYGTDGYLRYILRKKLAWERGILLSSTPEEMKTQLRNWLDLSLNHSVPSSLLILSRAFVPDKLKPAEAVQATLSSLPDEVVDSVGVTVLPSENTLEERKRKLELLKQQEELIKQEESSSKKPEKRK